MKSLLNCMFLFFLVHLCSKASGRRIDDDFFNDIKEQTPYSDFFLLNSISVRQEQLLVEVEHMNNMNAQLLEIAENQRKALTQEEQIHAKDCFELQNKGDSTSGIRKIYPFGDSPDESINVVCNQYKDQGGWTVIQTRDIYPQRENFNRGWDDYVNGFGNRAEEYWLGLENIRVLTNSSAMELRIDLENSKGERRYANYGSFSLDDSEANYRLHVGEYSGDAGDDGNNGFIYHDGQMFSTYDRDNDAHGGENCARSRKGGWWFKNCNYVNLNGLPYIGDYESATGDGIVWFKFGHWFNSMAKARMMIRPINKDLF